MSSLLNQIILATAVVSLVAAARDCFDDGEIDE